MNEDLESLNKQIQEEQQKIRDVQRKIMQKRAMLAKKKIMKTETKSSDFLKSQKSPENSPKKSHKEITIKNFKEFDLSRMGQDHIEELCKQRDENDKLYLELEKLKKDCDTFEMGKAQTKKQKPIPQYQTAPRRIEFSEKIEEINLKISELDKNMKAKNREIRVLQLKLNAVGSQKIDIDHPKVSTIVSDIHKLRNKIQAVEASILDMQNEYNIKKHNMETFDSQIAKVTQEDVDNEFREVTAMREELQEKETNIKKSIKQQESISSILEKKNDYYKALKKLKSKNKELVQDPGIPVGILYKTVNDLNQREFDSYEVINAALIRQRNENAKTEKYIKQQRENIQVNMAQLAHTVSVLKGEISSYKEKTAETETRLLARYEHYEKKLKDSN